MRFPDPGQVGDHVDTQAGQQRRWPDPGSLQDRRAGIGAGAQHHPIGADHLATGEAHAGGAALTHDHAIGNSLAPDRQVAAAASGR